MIFLKASRKAGRLKHVMYLITATLAGVVLSFIAHASIEMSYLHWVDSNGLIAPFYGGCALTPQIQVGLLVAGAVGGFLFGRWGWRRVYAR